MQYVHLDQPNQRNYESQKYNLQMIHFMLLLLLLFMKNSASRRKIYLQKCLEPEPIYVGEAEEDWCLDPKDWWSLTETI